MKALTLWQPYAQVIVAGFNNYETRSWMTNYRGRLAIHSSVKPLSKEYCALAEKYGLTDMAFGKVVAICDLEDCILMDEAFIKAQNQSEIDFGDWRVGRNAWKLKIVEILKESRITRGYQGLWNIDI